MNGKTIEVHENGLNVVIYITESGDVRFLSMKPAGRDGTEPAAADTDTYRLVEVQETGMNHRIHHGSNHKGSEPGYLLKFCSCHDARNSFGRKIEISQQYNGLYVTSHLQFYEDIPVVRSWTTLENKTDEVHVIEYVSSFALTGLESGVSPERDLNTRIYIPHNTWFGEVQWKKYTLNELGYDVMNGGSVKSVGLSETGTWSCSDYLPMGSYENASGISYTWQIETSGSWNWQINDIGGHMYINISGPSELENGFVKRLKPGEIFESIQCAVACVAGNFEKTIQAMTEYRRKIRRPNRDNIRPLPIFNDYMNCLMGNPTTEKLLPLIDAAAAAGNKYFCIDCGWYDDGPWWDGVGLWQPAKKRFPGGIREPLEYIRKKGMIPGLWLELEVMGIKCPLAKSVDKDWFFQRNGKIIIDENRYQLDYRNPKVRDYATEVVRRLVENYGVGYIKMDYNIDPGTGTDLNADSAGEGLLGHKRAYLAWLDTILDEYPDLVLENCSSGGMRMEYSLLSRCSLQSVSDQEDYIKMAAIAANCMTAVTPEQAAVWSYPLRTGSQEAVVFNMINAMLVRLHLSGQLAELPPDCFALVKEGVEAFDRVSSDTCRGVPFWPIGLASVQDNFISTGVDCGHRLYLAVWCTKKQGGTVKLPVAQASGKQVSVCCLYPHRLETEYKWIDSRTELQVTLQPETARLFQIDLQ